MNIHLVLLPVDGSEHSMRAAAYAANMVEWLNSQLLLFHCHKPFPVYLGEPYFQAAHDKIMNMVHDMLDPFRELLNNRSVAFSECILEGQPGQMICQAAEIEKCDLIIMGCRGRTDLQGLFLGSVTHRVLRSAPCPVLVVR